MDDNAPLKMLRPWKGVWRPIWSRREELGGFSFLISIFFVGMFSIGAPYFISNNIMGTTSKQCGIPRLPWIGASRDQLADHSLRRPLPVLPRNTGPSPQGRQGEDGAGTGCPGPVHGHDVLRAFLPTPSS